MTERILAPAAAFVSLTAALLAGAAITLLLSAPADLALATADGDMTALLVAMIEAVADAVWQLLRFM